MSQGLILTQFAKYLDITSRKYISELQAIQTQVLNESEKTHIDKEIQTHTAYVLQLKKFFLDGYCHGFAVCHAAMDCIGKLEWWENVLVALSAWDGSEKALEQQIILPGSVQTDQNKSLDHLFNRALNYIIYHQAEFGFSPDGFTLNDLNQFNLLESTDHPEYFEILTADNQAALFIKNYANAAGYFTHDELMKLLDANQIMGNICVVGSIVHSIRIGFNGQEWMIYDPNYQHTQLDTIHKIGTKDEIVSEMLILLKTNALEIQLATIQDNKSLAFPYFYEMYKNRKSDLIKKGGLLCLAQLYPGLTLELCQLAILPNNTDLFERIKLTLAIKIIPDAAFNIFIQYAPDAALVILKFAIEKKDSALLAEIATALTQKNNHNRTGLHSLAEKIPEVVTLLCKLVAETKNENLLIAIATFFKETDYQKCTGFQMLSERAPEAVAVICQFAVETNNQDLLAAITVSLKETRLTDNQTGLHVLAKMRPDTVLALCQFAVDTNNQALFVAVVTALNVIDDDNSTSMHIMASTAPHLFSLFIQHLLKHPDINNYLNIIRNGLEIPNNEHLTAWQMISGIDNNVIVEELNHAIFKTVPLTSSQQKRARTETVGKEEPSAKKRKTQESEPNEKIEQRPPSQLNFFDAAISRIPSQDDHTDSQVWIAMPTKNVGLQ